MPQPEKKQFHSTRINELFDFLIRNEIAVVLSVAVIIIVLLDILIYFLLILFDDYMFSTFYNKVNPGSYDALYTKKVIIIVLADALLFVYLCPRLSKAIHKIKARLKNKQ